MRRNILTFLIVVGVSLSMAMGQAISTNGGSIQGTITDPSGAAIPGAAIVIASPATGYTHSMTTDSAGYYSLGPLLPGSYTVTITAANFQRLNVSTVVRTGTVTAGSEKLAIGNSSETIEVNAGALQVNVDQIGVSGVVTQEQIDSLPINGRNILDVAQLQPGVLLQSGESFDPTKAGYSAISTSGVGGRTTRILLDGQDITDETVGTTIFNVPSGPIDELQLNRSTQDVSGEVTSTGQVLVSTRSGTNTFHGNAFYNFQDHRAGFANVNGVDEPFQRNQFGGYIGGYLIKDKLFFFGGAERIKQEQSNVAQGLPVFSSLISQFPTVPAPFRDTYSTARLDYAGPHGIHFFARASYSVNFDAATFGLAPYSVYSNRDNVPALVGGADFTTGKFTHSFRVGYEKFHNILGDGTISLGNSIYNPSTSAANQISLVGDFNAGPNYLAPQGTYQSDKQFRYDGTWLKGAHNFKFGFNMNRILNGGFAEFYGASLYTIFSSSNSTNTCADVAGSAPCPGDPTRGYTAAGYVLGNGNSLFSERPGFGLPGGGAESWRFGAYIADTWKVAPWMTFTGGLRWSVDTDRANQDLPTPLCSSVDPSLQFAGCTGNTPLFDQYQQGLGVQTHQPYANFGPQLGFVFSPGNHKTSVRGGIGIYYESDIFNNTGNARGESIQTPGAYFNYGIVQAGGSDIFLPGLGDITDFDRVSGAPCTTPGGTCVALADVLNETIYNAAPQINALKAYYQSQVAGSAASNPSYIGTGDALLANSIYAGPYKSPYSLQYNGGIQRELFKGLIVSADYVHNSTLKLPLSVDVNHDGAARTLNPAAAQHAIAKTLSKCGVATIDAAITACPGLHTDPTTGAVSGASITDFAGYGLDSGTSYLGGIPASAAGLTPNTGAAFAGTNANVGEGLFILPVGRSYYDALQLVLQQQKAHPVRGIVNSNLQISYSLSKVSTSNGGGSSSNAADQNFAGTRPWDNDDPNRFVGRNNIDHTNELSFGGSVDVKYGLTVGMIGHFFSSPAQNLTLDALAGNTGQLFVTDVDGDGTVGDLVSGSNPGAYMRNVKPGQLNQFINSYNTQHAGQLTPAGTAVVSAGLMTTGQLAALGGVQQPIAAAPSNPLPNSAFREFDLSAGYPIKLSRFREGLSLVPSVVMYNVFNMSNFGTFNPELLNTADARISGFFNGPSSQADLNANRIQRGAGTFSQGAPRSTEFQLKLNF